LNLTANNGVGSAATQPFTLTVDQVPAITSSNAASFTVGSGGSFTMTTTGFPISTLSESGALPTGVTFTDNGDDTATLAGTPAAGTAGIYPLNLTANNGVSSAATQTFTLTVDQVPAITSGSAASFTVGSSGSFTMTTNGFPVSTLSESGTLPSGVTFTDNGDDTATLAGTPAAGTAGIYPLNLTANNGVGSAATQTFTLTVDQVPAITSSNAASFTVGSSGSFTMTTTGFPVSTLSESGALPSGVTFTDNGDGTATLGGTPAAGTGGTYSLSLTANNGVGSAATQTITLTVNQAPAITSSNAATFTVGSAGSFTVTTTGFPISTLSESGGLPFGVTFTDNGDDTATLAGTPAAGTGGTYPLTLTANNGVGSNATQNFTLTVNQAPAITSTNAATFTVGSGGSFTMSTTGFPVSTLSESGALPSGVTFTDNGDGTATLSGTPAANSGGSYSLTLSAANGVGSQATQTFVLTVNQPPAITTTSAVTFKVGSAGTFLVKTTGYPFGSLTETGALPSGVGFQDNGNDTATLSGTPAPGSGGSYPIIINDSNGVGTPTTQSFVLSVDDPATILNSSSTTFTVGSPGIFTFTTSGFPPPVLTMTGTLPGGLSFQDNGNGTATLSGTPDAGSNGSFDPIVTATNGLGSPASQSFGLTVLEAPAITSNAAATFTVGSAGTFTVTTSGYPIPTSLAESGGWPNGVTFQNNNNGTATLAGTPTAGSGGIYDIGFTATNSGGSSASQNFVLTVDEAPVITSSNATAFTVGSSSSFSVTATGYPAPTLHFGGTLPSGVSFTTSNGTTTLSGTPATGSGGSYNLVIVADNGIGSPIFQAFVLTINEAPAITSSSAASFAAGSSGSFTMTTSGYPAATLSNSGTLPGGISFHDNGDGTATLSGTPDTGTGGTYPLDITADNGIGSPPAQTFNLTVAEAPAFTSATGATFSTAYNNTFSVITSGYPAPAISESGTLPSGVSFSSSNGTATLSGIPAAGSGGSYDLTFSADNGLGSPAIQSFVLTVQDGPAITSLGTTTFTVGSAGTFTFTASGFPVPALSESGALPDGLSFTGGNGLATLSGTPQPGTSGTYNLSITAADGLGNTASQSFVLTINDVPDTSDTGTDSAITSSPATTFTAGSLGTFQVTTTGDPTSSISASGTLPTGLSFSDNGDGTATLSGTPQPGSGGLYYPTWTAYNGVDYPATQSFLLTVDEAPAITSSSATTFTATSAGTSSSFVVTTTGYPAATLSESGALPSGFSFTSNGDGTATLTGAPIAGSGGGTYPITIAATNGVGSDATQNFLLTVVDAPAITSNSSTTFTAGSFGTFSVTTTGYPAPTITESGALPNGVSFTINPGGTATLNGTPRPGTGGLYTLDLTADNGVGSAVTQTFVLTVDEAPAITSGCHTTFTVGSAGTFSVTTLGYPAPSLSASGALPSAVTFTDNNNGTATLAGTPNAGSGGTYYLSFSAANSVGNSLNQTFVLIVDEAPAITSANTTTFGVGSFGSFTVTATGYPNPALSESGSLPAGVRFSNNNFGTATLSGMPQPGTAGTYILTFTASNGVPYPASQTFTLIVVDAPGDYGDPGPSGNEEPPVGVPDYYTVAENTTLDISASGVLGNDLDPAGGGLTAQLLSEPSNGTLDDFNSDGSFSYTPDPNFVGWDSFVYQPLDGSLVGSAATVTIDVTGPPIGLYGLPFAAAKGQAFSGGVADFAPFSGTTVSDYNALIFWGDGSSGAGSITAAGGLYDVSGSHTYAEEGPYVLAVEVTEPTIGADGVVLDYGLVLPLVPDTSLQSLASYSLSYSGSGALSQPDTGSYNLQSGGGLDYTLTVTDQGIGSTETDISTGALGFTEEAYYAGSGSGMDDYTSSAAASDTLSADLRKGDLSNVSTGTATGSDNVTNLSSSGDGSSGDFAWTWNETSTRSTTWQGTGSDGTSGETDSLSSTIQNTETGNFQAGDFSRTEIDNNSTVQRPSGNDWGENYTATSTQTASRTLTETGLLGGAVTAIITGSDNTNSHEADSDVGGSSSATAGSSDSYTQTVQTQETPGAYSSTRMLTGSDTGNDGGAEDTVDISTESNSDTFTLVETLTGDTSSGNYTLGTTQTDSGTDTSGEVDVSLTDIQSDTANASTTTVETGNYISASATRTVTSSSGATIVDAESDSAWSDSGTETVTNSDTTTIAGNYFSTTSLTENDTGASTATEVESDNGFTDTATTVESDSVSTTALINMLTGAFTQTSADSSSPTINDTNSDQGATDTSTTTGGDNSTTTETGNSLTGSYTTTVTDTNSETDTDNNSDNGATDSSTTTDSDTSTTTETGNAFTGAYTATTTDVNTPTVNDNNGDNGESDASDTTGGDTSTTTETGNSITGDYTATTTDVNTSTLNDNNSDNGASDGSTTTGSDTSTSTETGNSLTGAFSATVADVNTSTVTDTNSDNGESDSSTTTGGDTSTTAETGNSLTGAFTTTVTDGNTSTATDTNSDNGESDTSTTTGSDTSTTTETGNSFTGAFTTTVTDANTATVNDNNSDNGATDSSTTTGSDASTTTETGNSFTGAYNTTATDASSSSETDASSDNGETDSSTTTGSDTSTTTETGNSITGTFTTTAKNTSSETDNDTNSDSSESDTSATTGSDTSTTTENGNSLTGAYTSTVADTNKTTVTDTNNDNGASDNSTTTGKDTSATTETGNSLTGAFSTTVTDASTATVADNASDNGETDTSTTTSVDTGNTTETGNSITGDVTSTEQDTDSATVADQESDAGLSETSTTTGSDTATVTDIANLITGSDSSTTTDSSTDATTATGTDSRGSFTATTTDTISDTVTDTGNDITGDDAPTTTGTSSSTTIKSGGDGTNDYTQTVTTSNTSTTSETDNELTGTVATTCINTTSSTTTETGDPSTTPYTMTTTINDTATVVDSGNSLTGAATIITTDNTATSMHEVGGSSSVGYTLDKTDNSSLNTTKTGNSLTGDYTVTGSNSDTSTAIETNTNAAGSGLFTEVVSSSGTTLETENDFTGDYTLDESGTKGSTFQQSGDNGTGTFAVTEGTGGTYSLHETGNSIAGDYTQSETDAYSYSMTETNNATDSFTLTDSGAINETLNKTGNKVTGQYNATTAGSDTYTLMETGTSGGGYSETASGSESFTVAESGNKDAGEFYRTTTGGGSYTLTATGAGLSNSSGSTGYTLTETANPLSGNFSQTQTGTTRYDLLQGFNNVADTSGSSTPGHLNFVPYGVAFVDPTLEAKRADTEKELFNKANWGKLGDLYFGSDYEKGSNNFNYEFYNFTPASKALVLEDLRILLRAVKEMDRDYWHGTHERIGCAAQVEQVFGVTGKLTEEEVEAIRRFMSKVACHIQDMTADYGNKPIVITNELTMPTNEPADHNFWTGSLRLGLGYYAHSQEIRIGILFHEITHQVGTRDYAYFPLSALDANGPVQYKDKNGRPYKFTSNSYSINNADTWRFYLQKFYIANAIEDTMKKRR